MIRDCNLIKLNNTYSRAVIVAAPFASSMSIATDRRTSTGDCCLQPLARLVVVVTAAATPGDDNSDEDLLSRRQVAFH